MRTLHYVFNITRFFMFCVAGFYSCNKYPNYPDDTGQRNVGNGQYQW